MPDLKCQYCQRAFSQNWTRENHEKVCAFKFRKIEKLKNKLKKNK